MILLADAMVLIDLEHVDGLNVLTRLGSVEVLDVVLEECIHPSQPSLEAHVRTAGILVVQSDDA